MLFLKRLFQAPRFEAEARALYRQIAERARRPVLFTLYGVPDTIDGRFEMLCLHAYAVFHGLKGKGADAEALSQAVYDAMFADLDGALRELGRGRYWRRQEDQGHDRGAQWAHPGV